MCWRVIFKGSFTVQSPQKQVMEPLHQFLAFLNKFIALSEEDFRNIIEPHLSLRRFKKKEIITPPGEVENYFNFISSGLVRKFFVKGAEEVITQISTEGQIIHSQESFHSQRPSEYTIQAIEPTVLVSVSFEGLNTILSTNAAMERMGRLIVTYVLVLNDRWQISMFKLTPRERFLAFMNSNATLLQRTPQKYLASLLNIQPETFSRFKHLVKGS